jgi:hypothetical protein
MTTELYAKSGYPPGDTVGVSATLDPLPVNFVSNRVRIGLHGRNDNDFTELDYQITRSAKIETIKMMSQTKVAAFKRLRLENPAIEFIVRLYDDRIGATRRRPTPAEFAARFVPIIKSLQPYAVKYEVHNEPNHQELYEGWGPTLTDAKAFNTWFLDVYQLIKTAVPWAQLGFPGLALHHGGWRGDLPWAQACAEAVRKADWLGCHCYWQFGNHFSFDWGLYFTEYHKLFPDKHIEITEFGDSTPDLDRNLMSRQYVEYYQALQPYGGYVHSASAFLATSPDAMWRQFCWADLESQQPYPIVGAVGSLARTQVVSEASVDAVQGVKDWRGLLPTRYRSFPYDKRDVKGITYVVVHHSAGPSSWSANAGGSGHGLAGWDVSQTDRDPYPEITYHFVVNADGLIERCLPLDSLSWHAGALGMPSPGGVGINNWKGVAICLPGNFMGTAEPTDAQLQSTGRLCQALLKQLPGASIVGHRDVAPQATLCPGDTWAPTANSGWRSDLLKLVGGNPVTPPAYACSVNASTPLQMETGAIITVPVTVRNTGSRTWAAAGTNPVHVSYHWADPNGKQLIHDGERTDLPSDLASGQQASVSAKVKAPANPGVYELQWDLVEENVIWFSEKGAPMLKAAVTVATGVPAPTPLPSVWSASASHASADAGKALDNNPATAWSAGVPQSQGAWFMVDMGNNCVINSFKAQFPKGGHPRGFGLHCSIDKTNWTKVAESDDNRGDLNLTFPETRARYVRMDLLVPPWAMNEIIIPVVSTRAWTATASHKASDAPKALDGKTETVWTSGTPQAPGMWFQVDLGEPTRIRRLALESSKDEAPRGYKLSSSLDGKTWRELASRPLNYTPVDVTLGLPLARYLRVETTAADKLNAVWTIAECTIETAADWTVQASHNAAQTGLAVDGDLATAWTSSIAQTNVMWFQIDLGEPLPVGKVVLENPDKDFPRGLTVKTSTDGKTWTQVAKIVRFYAGPAEASFTPVQARHIRLEQSSDVVQVNRWAIPWSISDISIFPTST